MARRKGSYCQTLRTLQLLNRLWTQPGGIFFRTLASEVGVTERQIRRDLRVLQRAGYAVLIEPMHGRSAARLVTQDDASPTSERNAA